MNNLEIVQAAARESGTFSTLPSSVVGQTGRALKLVSWVSNAWTMIQIERDAWRWMRAEFPAGCETTAGTSRYTAASWNITDWAKWITDRPAMRYYPVSLYLKSAGVADEGEIREITWETYRTRYGRGTQTQNRPTEYAISPAGEICFGPVPDDTYVVNGEYRQSVQTLAANGDIPGCPADYHRAIAYRALMLLHENDEAVLNIAAARSNYAQLMAGLERDQLPAMGFGGDSIA